MSIELPSVDEVAIALRDIRDFLDPSDFPEETSDEEATNCEVRLQVWPDGEWKVRWGLSDYDQDHRGYWGASAISPTDSDKAIYDTAIDLLIEVEDAIAQAD
jgi:hypothetical protein